MNKIYKGIISVIVLLILVVVIVYAQNNQPATPVQAVPTHADAAVNLSSSATSAATITLTPNGTQYVVVYEIDIENCAGTSVPAGTTTTVTTTNIGQTFLMGSNAAAGQCVPTVSQAYPTGLKAIAPGTAVTYVLSTFATQQVIRVNVAWSSAF